MELTCPVCEIPMAELRSRGRVMWGCPSCHGRAVGIALLRRIADRSWANALWAHALNEGATGERPCPSCRRHMLGVSVHELQVDVCRVCQMVWFDRAEYERVPRLPERGERTLPQDALESLARVQASAIAAEYSIRYPARITPAEALPLVPGVAGLPLEAEGRTLAHVPWLTWLLSLVVAGIGIWSLVDAADAQRFGLLASDVDRLGGAPLLTSLFVHATWFQLLTNVYFLLFFGDNVEDFLGPLMFGALLLTGGIVGNVLHALFAANTTEPLMSSSGAISAIVVFYALLFPDVRLRVLSFGRWQTMPAKAGLLFWLLLKLASTQHILGRAEPSAWPYLGGVVVGVAFWLVLKDDVAGRARSGS